MRDGGAGRRRPLPADHLELAAPHVVHDHRHVAAGAVEMRLDHLQRERRRERRVERVAAALQDAHADRGRDPVRGGHDAERAVDLGPGGERVRSDEIHAAPGLEAKTTGIDHSSPHAGNAPRRRTALQSRSIGSVRQPSRGLPATRHALEDLGPVFGVLDRLTSARETSLP